MGSRMHTRENWSAEITLGAADANKTLLAAKTGRKTVVTHLVARVLVSAAQAITIAIGSVAVCKIGASEAVGSESFFGPAEYGLVGDSGTAVVITPAGVGPSLHVRAEGYYE